MDSPKADGFDMKRLKKAHKSGHTSTGNKLQVCKALFVLSHSCE